MRRRDFITLLGGVAARGAHAQAAKMPTIGWLSSGAPQANFVAAFQEGLRQTYNQLMAERLCRL